MVASGKVSQRGAQQSHYLFAIALKGQRFQAVAAEGVHAVAGVGTVKAS
jgi:hypothetical protein